MDHVKTAVIVFSLALGSACGEETESNPGSGGGAGSPSSGGSNASGGSSGSGGSASGSGGAGGSGAGSGGAAGTGGASGGSGGSAGSSGGSAGSAGSSGSGGQATTLSFFATSKGSGELGGMLGGLDGADAICQGLAEAAGAGDRVWRAYLSTSTEDAVDRIGDGPWYNFNGDMIAADPASLHADGLMRDPEQFVLDETGVPVPMDEHDILTGSTEEGMATDDTCMNWSSNDAGDMATVGHSDIPDSQFSPSWNSAHTSNCSPEGLDQTGGAGRLYCFASD